MKHLLLLIALFAHLTNSFLVAPTFRQAKRRSSSIFSVAGHDDWIELTEDGGVCKQVIEAGSGDPYESGVSVTTSYAGTICNGEGWDKEEVVNCWLLQQQGLDDLAGPFSSEEIDEKKLIDTDNFFTEGFVKGTLGVENKIACKKLVMAARRLAKAREEYPDGTEFDANNSYTFELGAGKVIRGMEVGVSSMKSGEVAELRIRSDYAYGPEGYRKANGDVLIPPFATISFHISLQ